MSTAEILAPAGLEPGIYRGMSMAEYLALPYVSGGGLERLNRSPLQFQHYLTEPPRRTEALDTGTALHLAILEPLLFDGRYMVAGDCAVLTKTPHPKPCGNPGKYLHVELGWLCGTHVKGAGAGLRTDVEILPAETHAAVIGMRDAIMMHPRARTLFEGKGEFEATIVFDDPITGVRCKIRPDRLVARAGMNVELKSTRDASAHAFQKQAENLGYFRKLALYRRGLKAVDWPYSDTAVVAVENIRPHDLVCYLTEEQGDDGLDGADREVTRLLALYNECARSDEWPGYATEFQPLRRPGWAARDNGEMTDGN